MLPVMPAATVGPEYAAHVMGGAALATAVDALQEESGQPLLWATVQFLAPSQNAEELTIQCEQIGGGQSIGQWTATVRMRDLVIQRVSAAVGAREPSEPKTFAVMPDIPKPDDLPEKLPDPNGSPSNLIGQVERRIAMEDHDRGIEAVWTRSRAGFALDATFLAVVSDFFLGAHPQTRTGTSLDATFRFIQSAPPGWVLSVTELAAFERGTVSGHARHFSEDGKLLAISSQTGVLPRIPYIPD
jgi:acyl-CoA thioesterase